MRSWTHSPIAGLCIRTVGRMFMNERSYVLFRRFPARSRHRLPTLHPLATRSPCHEESPMSLVSEHTDSSPPPKLARRTLLLACGAAFLAFLDLSVVNIAFPSLARDFPATATTTLTWVVSGYAVTFAALLTAAGRLADALGRRALLLAALTGFGVTSLLCALAPD